MIYQVSEDWLALGDELRAQNTLGQRQYRNRLSAHPNCQDPDHPGCRLCEPELFDADEDYEF